MTGVVRRRGRTTLLTAHKAIVSGAHPGNTIAAIREAAASGVPRLEVDVHSLAGPDYVVYHERRLETETTAAGSVGQATREMIRESRFLHDGGDRPPLLSELVEAVRGSAVQVQLDLKDWRPLAPERVRALLDAVAPVRERVIISTGQDWNLVRLHRAAPDLALGFDPGHYFDHAIEGANIFLPRQMGAYGYRDDHPMAVGRTEDVRDYLRERCTMLALQAPWAREFFLSFILLLQMWRDGFNAVDWLHERGIAVTAWTPDFNGSSSVEALDRLIDLGVDRITTNTVPAWMQALAPEG